jgi:phage repressor protein C with HTH and peptisase S24 domain
MGEQTELVARLRQLMQEAGHTQKGLALKAELNETAVRDILIGKSRNPQYQTLSKLARVLGCDVADLTGEDGGMGRRNAATKTTSVAQIIELDVQASAGAGSVVEYEDESHLWAFPDGWIRAELNTSPGSLYIITIEGDSMPGILEPGDKAVVNVADRAPTPPGVFIVHDGLGLVAKRVEHLAHSDPPTVRIMSTNPAYRDYERTLEEAHILGRVVARWQRLGRSA